MTQKRTTAVDAHIGSRMRTRRLVLNMTQDSLAERLGITFQQIQKYEKGSNRISASRLLDVAAILDVPPTYFFEGLDGTASKDGSSQNLLVDRDGADLLRAFNSIEDRGTRRAIISVVTAASRAST